MPTRIPPGHFSILYFASAGTYTRKTEELLRAPIEVTKLFDLLEERYKGIKDKILSSCLITVNMEYVDIEGDAHEEEKVVIKEGDEVAIIPPVSSG